MTSIEGLLLELIGVTGGGTSTLARPLVSPSTLGIIDGGTVGPAPPFVAFEGQLPNL